MPTAVAQDDGGPTASPTPGDLEMEVEGITPEVGLVGDILGTDVDEEGSAPFELSDSMGLATLAEQW